MAISFQPYDQQCYSNILISHLIFEKTKLYVQNIVTKVLVTKDTDS